MKKFWPLILLLVSLLVVVGAFFFIRGRKASDLGDAEETALLNVTLEERPVVSLTPTNDGHYLHLMIDKIVIDAESLDYELLYQTGAGVTQGVPGTVSLGGRESFEAELLLGSESSGNFRYDEGVETGTITLRFRNRDGKLLAKFTSEFHLQTATDFLTSADGSFAYNLDAPSNEYFVVMNTIGIPGVLPGQLAAGPWGVFSSSENELEGLVELSSAVSYFWNGEEWVVLESGSSENIGIFFGSSS